MLNGDFIFVNWKNNVINGICLIYIKAEHLIYKCKFSNNNMDNILKKENYKDFTKNSENNDNSFENIFNFDLFELSEKVNGIGLWEIENKIK